MAVQVLSLTDGKLLQSPTTALYTSTSPLTTIVKSIRLVNTASSPRTVNLYFLKSTGNPSTDKRRIAPCNMSLGGYASAVDDQELTMGAGDTIWGDASVDNDVHYVISGIQR